jgi:hypothetical protein
MRCFVTDRTQYVDVIRLDFYLDQWIGTAIDFRYRTRTAYCTSHQHRTPRWGRLLSRVEQAKNAQLSDQTTTTIQE